MKTSFLSLCTALSLASASFYATATEFTAGFAFQSFQAGTSGKIDTGVWYPAKAPERQHQFGPSNPTMAFNAPALPGTYPLVLISHGTSGMLLNHHQLAAALARAGMLVVALTHPGDNFEDQTLVGTPSYFSERPLQVSRTLDALLASARWSALIDAQRIAVLGHSAGGFTALALSGARPSIAKTLRHCAEHYDADPWFCGVSGSKETAQQRAALASYVPETPLTTDPRIKAAVLIAPVGAFFEDSALAAIRIPLRIYVPAKDTVLTPAFHGERVAAAQAAASVERMPNAGHFSLMSPLMMSVEIRGAAINEDPAGFDRAAAIARAGKEIPDWLHKVLQLRP
jgi:predicted dienelactone hydrolase